MERSLRDENENQPSRIERTEKSVVGAPRNRQMENDRDWADNEKYIVLYA
jgi:hypothetical protein